MFNGNWPFLADGGKLLLYLCHMWLWVSHIYSLGGKILKQPGELMRHDEFFVNLDR